MKLPLSMQWDSWSVTELRPEQGKDVELELGNRYASLAPGRVLWNSM